jgi:hypothetical protein
VRKIVYVDFVRNILFYLNNLTNNHWWSTTELIGTGQI